MTPLVSQLWPQFMADPDFAVQLNNRGMKDRSFSRKIESERSFFVSEGHRIRWISGEVYSMYSRKVILWRQYGRR